MKSNAVSLLPFCKSDCYLKKEEEQKLIEFVVRDLRDCSGYVGVNSLLPSF